MSHFWTRLGNFLNGFLWEEVEQRLHFKNDVPLHLVDYGYDSISTLNLSDFPLCPDFEIRLRDTKYFGFHLDFYSPTLGTMASFPWWDNVEKDLRQWNLSNIPSGDFDTPFDDLEQGWQILIFEDEEYVYVLEGDDPVCTEFNVWFKVDRSLYFSKWTETILRFNPCAL